MGSRLQRLCHLVQYLSDLLFRREQTLTATLARYPESPGLDFANPQSVLRFGR